VNDRARYLSKAFVTADFDFYSKYLRDVKEMEPRWKRCVKRVDRDLGEALGQVFVEKTFTPETKASAVAMTREIERPWKPTSSSSPGWAARPNRRRSINSMACE